MRVASFFAGIGGFDLGFENSGCEIVFQCEIDPFCQKILKARFPGVPLCGNIVGLDPSNIPEADIWCGGFPCQDLSLANQGKRKGLEGDRSGLFYEYSRLIGVRKPKWVVLENVVGLLNSNNGADFRVLLETLDGLGYCVAWRVLDSKYFGTPQRRRRCFIVGSLGNSGSIRVLFGQGAVTDMARKARLPGAHAASRFAEGHRDPNFYVIQHASIGRKAKDGPQAKGYRSDGETYTLDSRGSSDVICQTNVGFRVREASGVSSQLDGRRFRVLGNAVNVQVATWLGSRIVETNAIY